MEVKMLTVPLLREMIEPITVYKTEGVGKNRNQRIVIRYKFVGMIGIPAVSYTHLDVYKRQL